MSAIDLMLLPAPDPPGAITVLHLEGGRWRMQPPPTSQVTPEEARSGVEELLEQVVRELDNPAPDGYLDAMQERMQAMFDAVIPGELGTKLSADPAAAPDDPPLLRLHIAPQVDRYPWELMHDGLGFLGLRYRIARLPLVSGGPRPTNGSPRAVGSIASLLGENVLQGAQREAWRDTFEGLIQGAVELKRRPQADDWPTLSAVKASLSDVMYLVCHGLRGDNGEVFWSLNDDRPGSPTLSIRAAQAQSLNLQVREPLVFANACHPLAGAAAATAHDLASASFGFQFFSFGASAYVGTIAPISKRVAIPFATAFFRRLFVGHSPLGDALRETRRQFFDAADPDPSYLFYALYGDPEMTFAAGA